MYNYCSKFFSESFKAEFFKKMDEARIKFIDQNFRGQQVISYRIPWADYSLDLMNGYRAQSNEECFQAFCSRQEQNKINGFSTQSSDELNVLCANRIETKLSDHPDVFEKELLQALISSMDCDHHYAFEKDYT